ncbi:MAG: UPF0149 family protein [Sinobacterium sp.]|nr:UPF0149 family protein [Sinobacterium sp.]
MTEPVQKQLDFDEVADLMVQIGSHTSPSELHGFLCGQLAAGQRSEGASFTQTLQESLDVQDSFSPEQLEKLRFVYMSSLNALMDDEMSFYPLLADDDAEITTRLATLSQWCQNFLSGVATVEKAIKDVPEIVNDALNDMAAISQVGVDEAELEEDEDAAEEDYAQLVEYIRLATMNIFMEYIPAPTAPKLATQPSTEQGYLSAQDLFKQRKIH